MTYSNYDLKVRESQMTTLLVIVLFIMHVHMYVRKICFSSNISNSHTICFLQLL